MAARGHRAIYGEPSHAAAGVAAPGGAPFGEVAAFGEVASFGAVGPVADGGPEPEVLIRPPVRREEPPGLVPGYRSPAELRQARQAQRAGADAGGLEVASGLDEVPPVVRDASEGSFGIVSVFEIVLGIDDRIALEDERVRTNPWRQIAALRIRSTSGSEYVGTAWFIAPSVLATAAHCVFLRDDGGWAASIDVIPGLAGATEPYGRVTASKYACADGWRDEGNRDFDYGVIFLDGPDVGTRVGNFAVEAMADADLKGALSRISGYPSDRDRASRQYYHERPLRSVTPTRLNYDIDTFGGQSGSPIWLQLEGRGSVAVGIHTTGTATGNSGTRITDPVLENLVTWTEELP